MNDTTKKPGGKGRTLGAVSFATVGIEQLTGLPANTLIPVSRRWAEMLKLQATAIVSTTKTLKTLSEPASVTVTQPEPVAETVVPTMES
jgi:hypothetical protein